MKNPGREDILDLALRIGRREGVGQEWILWPSWVTPPAEGRCAMAKAAAVRRRARAILAGDEKMPSWLQREDAAVRRKETPGPSAAPAPPAAVTDFSGIDPPFSAGDLAFAVSPAGRAALAAFIASEKPSAERPSPPPAETFPEPPAPPCPASEENCRLPAKPPRRRRAVSGALRREPSWQAVTDLALRLGARKGISRKVMLWPRWVSPPEDWKAYLNIADEYRRTARSILRGEEDAPEWMQAEDEAARRRAAAARAEEAARAPIFPLPPPPPGARDVLRAAPLAAAFLLQRQAAGNVRARPPPVVWRVPRRSQAGLSRAAAPPAPAGHAGRERSIPIPVRLFDNGIAVYEAGSRKNCRGHDWRRRTVTRPGDRMFLSGSPEKSLRRRLLRQPESERVSIPHPWE